LLNQETDLVPMLLPMKMMKRWFVMFVLALLGWWGLTTGMSAQGTSLQLESRVDRVESELSRVQSRLNQLEARNNMPSPASRPSDGPNRLNEPSLEAQFDNLATLAIELRQDVRALQTQVAELEAARGGGDR